MRIAGCGQKKKISEMDSLLILQKILNIYLNNLNFIRKETCIDLHIRQAHEREIIKPTLRENSNNQN